MYSPNNLSLDIAAIITVFLVPLIFVVIGVLYMIHQCRYLANEINAGGGDDSARSTYQKVMTDLAALRHEHRTHQEAVKADIEAEMDALRKIQTDMSEQMGEIKTMVQQLSKAQGKNDKKD